MAHLRIHCGDCGSVWEVHKYLPDGATPTFCPQCGSEIDGDIWENEIIPAFGSFRVIADHYDRDDVRSEQ